MSSQPTEEREPLDDGITQEQIQKLIDERKSVGATSCEVVKEKNQRILVCQYPPL